MQAGVKKTSSDMVIVLEDSSTMYPLVGNGIGGHDYKVAGRSSVSNGLIQ